MPYFTKKGTGKDKGKTCVYKKEDKTKVGCTDGPVEKYLAALHMNESEEGDFEWADNFQWTRSMLMDIIDNCNDIMVYNYSIRKNSFYTVMGKPTTYLLSRCKSWWDKFSQIPLDDNGRGIAEWFMDYDKGEVAVLSTYELGPNNRDITNTDIDDFRLAITDRPQGIVNSLNGVRDELFVFVKEDGEPNYDLMPKEYRESVKQDWENLSNEIMNESEENDFDWIKDVEGGYTEVDTSRDEMNVWPQFEEMLAELGVTNLEGEVVSYDDEGTCKLLLKSDYFEFEVHANFDYIETKMVSWSIQNVKNYGYVKDEYSLDTNNWLKPIVDKLKEMVIKSLNKYKKMNESEDELDWIRGVEVKPKLSQVFHKLEEGDIITLMGEVENGITSDKTWVNKFVIELSNKRDGELTYSEFTMTDLPINNDVKKVMDVSNYQYPVNFLDSDSELEVLSVVRDGKEIELHNLNESDEMDWIRDIEADMLIPGEIYDIKTGNGYYWVPEKFIEKEWDNEYNQEVYRFKDLDGSGKGTKSAQYVKDLLKNGNIRVYDPNWSIRDEITFSDNIEDVLNGGFVIYFKDGVYLDQTKELQDRLFDMGFSFYTKELGEYITSKDSPNKIQFFESVNWDTSKQRYQYMPPDQWDNKKVMLVSVDEDGLSRWSRRGEDKRLEDQKLFQNIVDNNAVVINGDRYVNNDINESDDLDWIRDINLTPIDKVEGTYEAEYDIVLDYFKGRDTKNYRGWKYASDYLTGSIEWWHPNYDGETFFATPFWDGQPGLPIDNDGESNLVDLPEFNYKEDLVNWLENKYEKIVFGEIQKMLTKMGYDLTQLNESEEDEFEWIKNIEASPNYEGQLQGVVHLRSHDEITEFFNLIDGAYSIIGKRQNELEKTKRDFHNAFDEIIDRFESPDWDGHNDWVPAISASFFISKKDPTKYETGYWDYDVDKDSVEDWLVNDGCEEVVDCENWDLYTNISQIRPFFVDKLNESINEVAGISFESRKWAEIINNEIKNNPQERQRLIIDGYDYPEAFDSFPIDYVIIDFYDRLTGYGQEHSGYDKDGNYIVLLYVQPQLVDGKTSYDLQSALNHEMKHAWEDYNRLSKGLKSIDNTKESQELYNRDFILMLSDKNVTGPIKEILKYYYYLSKLEKSAYLENVYDGNPQYEKMIREIAGKDFELFKDRFDLDVNWHLMNVAYDIPFIKKFKSARDFIDYSAKELRSKALEMIKKINKMKYIHKKNR